jgi:hypothetical protein
LLSVTGDPGWQSKIMVTIQPRLNFAGSGGVLDGSVGIYCVNPPWYTIDSSSTIRAAIRDPLQQRNLYVKGRAAKIELQLREHVRRSLKRLAAGTSD